MVEKYDCDTKVHFSNSRSVNKELGEKYPDHFIVFTFKNRKGEVNIWDKVHMADEPIIKIIKNRVNVHNSEVHKNNIYKNGLHNKVLSLCTGCRFAYGHHIQWCPKCGNPMDRRTITDPAEAELIRTTYRGLDH